MFKKSRTIIERIFPQCSRLSIDALQDASNHFVERGGYPLNPSLTFSPIKEGGGEKVSLV
ncbi:hypothetical protein [Xanthovirga aplysinae]|uniref:hypothetical protein n=1 Tax=Xanthovirga aplysinae TaxID=2529853 RepID=UPI0012BC75D7|nr:hypothetical protein [Xanthovirga aplysinae]MTI29557.1 hypothetical protein [Xanthovirga aplysinae]